LARLTPVSVVRTWLPRVQTQVRVIRTWVPTVQT